MRRSGFCLFVVLLPACGQFGRGLSPIRLESIVTIGATSGEGAIATTPAISARHPGGFRVVTPAFSAFVAPPMIFADDGAYLGTLSGDGTRFGSFGGATFTRFGPGDSIWVFDNSGRVLIFSPARRYVRTITLSVAPEVAIVLRDSRIVVNGDSVTTAELHDVRGELVRVIGGPAAGGPRTYSASTMLPVPDGTFWTTAENPPGRLEHWDTAGNHLGTIDLHSDWYPQVRFTPLDDSTILRRAPEPAATPGWIDAQGRVWVIGTVADKHWERGLAPKDSAHSTGFPVDFDKWVDTIIEVRDLATGRVIASATFDKYYAPTAEAGVLAHVTRTSGGWRRAELARVVFDPPTSRP